MDLIDENGTWDSVLLEPLTEESFLTNLSCRYDSNTNYVSNMNLRVLKNELNFFINYRDFCSYIQYFINVLIIILLSIVTIEII